MTRNFTLGLLLTLAGTIVASAQDRPEATPATPATAVTVSVSANGVRFAALGSVKQMRLEVFGADGSPLYSSDFRPGNVRDWKLEDTHGLRLPDGTYLCVVTFRDVSGRLGMKQGAVLVQGGQAALQLAGGDEAGAVEAEKRLDPMTETGATALTLMGHDGSDGQVVSTRGGLSFRAGDFFAGKDRELMRLTPGGDLGLGVSAPKAKLDVAGTIRARGGIQFEDGTVLTSARGAGTSRTSVNSPPADGSTAAFIGGTGTANKRAKWLDGSGTLGDSVMAEAGGNVGIGTASPQRKLHVTDAIRVNQFDVGLNAAGDFVFRNINDSTGSYFRVSPNGATAAGIPRTNIQLFNTDWAAGQANYEAGEMRWNNDAFEFNVNHGGTGVQRPMVFSIDNTERMRLNSNGNVGIGTANPQSRLEVAGDLKVTGSAVVDGNIAAKYQDVAEWVRAREPLAAGTVVVLDAVRADTVRASARPYDTHVAGVVSAQPGVVLGQAGEGKVMVATTGRVKVCVDATRRPIRIGDLLVTSGKSGVAMRSLPVRVPGARLHRPGTIIGKALEPLGKGKGEILVLLSLQ